MEHTRIFLLLIFLTPVQPVNAELGTIISAGYGLGESHTQGDYTQVLNNTVFSMGYDYDYQRGLFLANGISSTKNDFKQMDLIFGYGNKYIKVGTGFISLQTSVPTNPQHLFDTSGQFATDERKRIDLSVTTIPIFLRVKPIATDNFNLVIDGYYGLDSRGSMTFPFISNLNGGYGTVSSIPQKQGGAKGYSISVIWRLRKMVAISLEYQHREATMIKQTSRIQSDILGILGTVTTPEMTFQNSALLLKVVLVK